MNKIILQDTCAGEVTRAARKKLESNINKSVISKSNYNQLIDKKDKKLEKFQNNK
jgi:hypothetical protein